MLAPSSFFIFRIYSIIFTIPECNCYKGKKCRIEIHDLEREKICVKKENNSTGKVLFFPFLLFCPEQLKFSSSQLFFRNLLFYSVSMFEIRMNVTFLNGGIHSVIHCTNSHVTEWIFRHRMSRNKHWKVL